MSNKEKLNGIEGVIKMIESLKVLGVSESSINKIDLLKSVSMKKDLLNFLKKHNLKLK